ncbi:hypothetical protein IPL85_00560 [Candidatus Saccharibacteria bacterium]|nr:MAG: hypothetical protein IPL85_00560 [Candidatus Saccharibacteria bacterium]
MYYDPNSLARHIAQLAPPARLTADTHMPPGSVRAAGAGVLLSLAVQSGAGGSDLALIANWQPQSGGILPTNPIVGAALVPGQIGGISTEPTILEAPPKIVLPESIVQRMTGQGLPSLAAGIGSTSTESRTNVLSPTAPLGRLATTGTPATVVPVGETSLNQTAIVAGATMTPDSRRITTGWAGIPDLRPATVVSDTPGARTETTALLSQGTPVQVASPQPSPRLGINAAEVANPRTVPVASVTIAPQIVSSPTPQQLLTVSPFEALSRIAQFPSGTVASAPGTTPDLQGSQPLVGTYNVSQQLPTQPLSALVPAVEITPLDRMGGATNPLTRDLSTTLFSGIKRVDDYIVDAPGTPAPLATVITPLGVAPNPLDQSQSEAPTAPTLQPAETVSVLTPSRKAYSKAVEIKAEAYLQMNIREKTGNNDGLPAKLFMEGREGRDWPWCAGAAWQIDTDAGYVLTTNRPKAAWSSGRIVGAYEMMLAIENEPGSKLYTAADFRNGKLNDIIVYGDYLFYRVSKKTGHDGDNHVGRFSRFDPNGKGYWSFDGNLSDRFKETFHKWEGDDLTYVGMRFVGVSPQQADQPKQKAPTPPQQASTSPQPVFNPATRNPLSLLTPQQPSVAIAGLTPGTVAIGVPAEVTPVADSVDKPEQVDSGVNPLEMGQTALAGVGSLSVVVSPTPTQAPGASPLDGTITPLNDDKTATPSSTEGASKPAETNKSPAHKVMLEAMVNSIIYQESRGNPRSFNSDSGAAGLGNWMVGTWGGRGGFKSARDAPPQFQYDQMRREVGDIYKKFSNDKFPDANEESIWKDVAGGWYAGSGWKSKGYDVNRGQGGGKYPSIAQYWTEVVNRAKGYVANPASVPKITGVNQDPGVNNIDSDS